ncbi:hypothetical protein ACEK07_04695 [Alcanivoracaceae bacterium MT1]
MHILIQSTIIAGLSAPIWIAREIIMGTSKPEQGASPTDNEIVEFELNAANGDLIRMEGTGLEDMRKPSSVVKE